MRVTIGRIKCKKTVRIRLVKRTRHQSVNVCNHRIVLGSLSHDVSHDAAWLPSHMYWWIYVRNIQHKISHNGPLTRVPITATVTMETNHGTDFPGQNKQSVGGVLLMCGYKPLVSIHRAELSKDTELEEESQTVSQMPQWLTQTHAACTYIFITALFISATFSICSVKIGVLFNVQLSVE